MGVPFNASVWLLDRHLEQGRGDNVAVCGPGQTLTYAELAGEVGHAAAGLRELGLRRDDRVVFVTADDVPMYAGLLATMRAGFVAVPVSTMLGGQELGTIVADSGASVLMVSAPFAEAAAEAITMAPELRTVITDGDVPLSVPEGIRTLSWTDLVTSGQHASADAHAPAPTDEDSWALWLYTSGTTGTPKGAMHRHANLKYVCDTYATQVLGIRESDRCLSVAKLFFAYGFGNSMLFPMSVGAATILEPRRPTPDVIAERLSADQPTLFYGVPTFFAALAASGLPHDSFASVRLATSAGEPLPPALQERFTSRFGVDIIDGIGSTEALHIFLSNAPGRITPGSTGVPVPGYDIELRDLDGNVVPDGEPGSLHVRGASIALGYWRRTDASRAVFLGEWLATGDTYIRAEDGTYTCLGRSNDLLKAGGIWVSPAEVEARLLQHERVAEVAVVGVPDEDGLDKPVAVVVPAGDVEAQELIQWCRDGLAAFKRPRSVHFVTELPKTATGKMQRFKVRELVAQMPREAEPVQS